MSESTSLFRISLSFLKKAILKPERNPSDARICTRFFMKPVIYDLYSLCIQLLDIRRIMRLPMPDSTDNSEAATAIRHNLQEIKSKAITTTRRVETAYQIATTPWRPLENEKLLIIGCRNVMELHQAKLAGFSWKNIFGLDLFSTNDKILSMNMEDMSGIADNSYDVVSMVNTLTYSTKPYQVFSEILRILKPGGRFVFNYGRQLEEVELTSRYTGEKFIEANRIPSSDFLKYIHDNGGQLYFHNEYEATNSVGVVQANHWFGFIKTAPSQDPIWPQENSK